MKYCTVYESTWCLLCVKGNEWKCFYLCDSWWTGLSFWNVFHFSFQRLWRLRMSRWMKLRRGRACVSVLSLYVRRKLCVRRRARAGLPLEAAFASGASAIIPSSPDTILILTESDICKVSRSGYIDLRLHACSKTRSCLHFRNLLWSRSDTSFNHNNLIIYTITRNEQVKELVSNFSVSDRQ